MLLFSSDLDRSGRRPRLLQTVPIVRHLEEVVLCRIIVDAQNAHEDCFAVVVGRASCKVFQVAALDVDRELRVDVQDGHVIFLGDERGLPHFEWIASEALDGEEILPVYLTMSTRIGSLSSFHDGFEIAQRDGDGVFSPSS